MKMKGINMMVYPKELVYQIYTNTRLQIVTWGGSFRQLTTFFNYGIRAG